MAIFRKITPTKNTNRGPKAAAIHITSSGKWRKWLLKHSGDTNEVWVVFYKKGSGVRSISYDESVEEAICFGWIDSRVRNIDESRFAVRFGPRRPGSGWSKFNRARALKMIHQGRMTAAGYGSLAPDIVRDAKGGKSQ
jgi:uncharacterized protein YdeI (YjbR/CyaY-like superfamily)